MRVCTLCGRDECEAVPFYPDRRRCVDCMKRAERERAAARRAAERERVAGLGGLREHFAELAERDARLAAATDDEICRRRLLRGAAFWRRAAATGRAA